MYSGFFSAASAMPLRPGLAHGYGDQEASRRFFRTRSEPLGVSALAIATQTKILQANREMDVSIRSAEPSLAVSVQRMKNGNRCHTTKICFSPHQGIGLLPYKIWATSSQQYLEAGSATKDSQNNFDASSP